MADLRPWFRRPILKLGTWSLSGLPARRRRQQEAARARLCGGCRECRRNMVPLIDVRNLSKTYNLGEVKVHAVADVTLQIERGSFLAIMGPCGSGKSSFVNLLGCLDRPTSGRYFLDGVPVESLDRDQLA